MRRALAVRVWTRRFQNHARRKAALDALRAQQWLAPAALHNLQNHKLQLLINHAYDQVPYYREVMQERGLRPENIRSAADLPLLPVLTKEIIRTREDNLRARGGVGRRHLIRANHTGGSTGAPLTFYQDQEYRDWGDMDLMRNYEMCGYRLGEPIAFLWGSDYDARPHRSIRGKLRDFADNKLYLDAFDSTEQDLLEYARRLARQRPKLLVGYVSSLTLLARIVQAHGLAVRPGAIQSSAEVLSPAQRELLEQTFHCAVFDRFGCREVGNIAHECDAHTGLHVLADNNVVEIVRHGVPVPAEEEGEIAVTNLNNMTMPFIRYVNGDLAVSGGATCSCGRGMPLLRRVVGRSADIIVAPSGKLMHGEFFTHLFYKLQGVKEFQVVQRTPERLEISIVPETGFDTHAAFAFLRSVIHEYGDPKFDVQCATVNNIPRSASGKFRFTVSEVPVPLASAGVK